jgi:hypothetical protein
MLSVIAVFLRGARGIITAMLQARKKAELN